MSPVMTKAEEVSQPCAGPSGSRARGTYRRAPHSRRTVPAQPGTHCRPLQRNCRAGSHLRALSRKLRPAHHVHAGDMQRRSFARRRLRRLQPESGSHSAPRSFSNHSCRLRDRIHLPYSRHSTKTGRMAASRFQHRDGAAAFRPSFVRHERIPGSGGFVLAARGIALTAAAGNSGLGAVVEVAAAEIARRRNHAGARGAGRKVSKASRGRDGCLRLLQRHRSPLLAL